MATMAKILVVDDDPLLLDLLLETLKTIGYAPVGASGGEVALKLLEQSDIQLVITDIKMPGMNGVELARQVRAINNEIPIIFITGVYDPTHLQQFEADGFLAKPFRINQIERLIEESLSKKYNSDKIVSSDKILVVDDDDSFRLMLIEALKLFGYKSVGASDSVSAMRLLRKDKISIVVTDINLSTRAGEDREGGEGGGGGGEDGRTLARNIRKEYPAISIVFVTAYQPADLKDAPSDNKEDTVLLKPFKIEEMIDILERLSTPRQQSVGQTDQ